MIPDGWAGCSDCGQIWAPGFGIIHVCPERIYLLKREYSALWEKAELGAAWAEAVAAAEVKGWAIVRLVLLDDEPPTWLVGTGPAEWCAEAKGPESEDGTPRLRGIGSTPAAALRALAAKLREEK